MSTMPDPAAIAYEAMCHSKEMERRAGPQHLMSYRAEGLGLRGDQRVLFVRCVDLCGRGFTVAMVRDVMIAVLMAERLTGQPFNVFKPFEDLAQAVREQHERRGEVRT